jgi:tellurite resistance protein TehA-like permease
MISRMTPVWIFPAYPLLVVGPHAGILSSKLEQRHAFDIIIGGFTIQGVGFLVSMMVYASYIYRLMTQKLPQESTRPGMFVSIGPSAFTVAGVLNMAENIQGALPEDFMGDRQLVGTILRVMASWMCLWIWGYPDPRTSLSFLLVNIGRLAFWFFFISIGAHWSCVRQGRMVFEMSWYSFIFPNTALITATFAVGNAFKSRTIQIIGCVLTPILLVVWIFVFGMMIRAIILEQILWPQKGDDKDEIGFKGPESMRLPNTMAV